jgi:hypothetical protein
MSHEFSNHSEAPDDLKHVEQTLAATTPRPPQIDRDRVMFLAGAASVKGSGIVVQGSGTRKAAGRWTWPAATAALAATSLALAIALIVRTNAPPQVVYIERPAPAAPAMRPQVAIQTEHSPVTPAMEPVVAAAPRPAQAPQVPPDNYLRTREVALRMGLDALAAPRGASGNSASPMTYFDWLAGLGNDSSSLPPVSENDSSLPKM